MQRPSLHHHPGKRAASAEAHRPAAVQTAAVQTAQATSGIQAALLLLLLLLLRPAAAAGGWCLG
jgi:hypothetical protein